MILNLKPQTVFAVHLRADSVSGGKDWVGSVTTDGEIHTYWGRTGQISQHAGKPGDVAALNRIIDQKKSGKDRYQEVDRYTQQHGWESQRTQATQATPFQQPKPVVAKVDWVEAPDAAIEWDF